MEKQEIIKKLETLESLISSKDNSLKRLGEIENAINSINCSSNSELNVFDLNHKSDFINKRVGERPATLNKFNPLNHFKKRKEEQEQALREYEKKISDATKEYFDFYKKEREQLEVEFERLKEEKIIAYKNDQKEITGILDNTYKSIESIDLISDALKKHNIIQKLITYFKEGRADTIKEAVNLFYDEEYKEKEAALAKEHRNKVDKTLLEMQKKISELNNKITTIECNMDNLQFENKNIINKIDDITYKVGNIESEMANIN